MPSVIDEIAKALNISNASVSRALNDKPGVSAALRQRILDKAREFNYTPSATARGLATSQTFAIGFFMREKPGLTTYSDPFYGEILQGVVKASAETHYHVTVATLTDDMLARPDDFRFVRERRIDGMILAGPDIPNAFIIAMLQTELPVVLVDNCLGYSAINCVNSDDWRGAYMAVNHLIQHGHRHIGIITGPKNWASNARRINGYRQALDEADLPLNITHAACTTIDSGADAYTRLMALYPETTAICAVNDSMAIGAIRAARAAGKQVPTDLSVIGFDDIDWASFNDPPLTTINIPKLQMGQEAVNRLITLLGNDTLQPTELNISVQVVERASVQKL
ncbi:MAG: LacI family DNA-binding transcriptional regulator [Anaerolineae bacterium]|nr:LacI family DNA-binding transcriptional regulator [Anaerolineae bacterium]